MQDGCAPASLSLFPTYPSREALRFVLVKRDGDGSCARLRALLRTSSLCSMQNFIAYVMAELRG